MMIKKNTNTHADTKSKKMKTSILILILLSLLGTDGVRASLSSSFLDHLKDVAAASRIDEINQRNVERINDDILDRKPPRGGKNRQVLLLKNFLVSLKKERKKTDHVKNAVKHLR